MHLSGKNTKSVKTARVRAVIFDLDNTLYDYEPCNRAGQVAVFQFLQPRLQLSGPQLQRAFNQARATIHQRLRGQAASHSRLLYIQTMIEQKLGRVEPKLALQAENIFWQAYTAKMQLRPGVLQLLRDLRRQSFRLAVASDLTTAIQLRKLVQLKLAKLFDVVVTSEEVGHEKPHPAILRLTLNKLQLTAKQVVMIGDSDERDATAARQAGMTFLRLATNSDIKSVQHYFNS